MRNLELSQETAKRWYEGTNEELKRLALQTYPELAKKELPKSWKEVEIIKGYYVTILCEIEEVSAMQFEIDDSDRNIFATKEQAEASIALAQLSQLREVYRDGWVPDWSANEEDKFCIEFYNGNISLEEWGGRSHFLSFQDEETRDLFLENFRDLIEKAKPLMS